METTEIHRKNTLECPVNIHKNSLQLLPLENIEKCTKYQLKFEFDSSEPCQIQISLGVTHSSNETEEQR